MSQLVPESDQSGLSCRSISFGYGNGTVLEGVTIGVHPGEVLAVIGPSGTGKTTLLRIMALFNAPTDGTVFMAGGDVWGLDEPERLAVRRRIGMVFQQPNLFDTSVRRNVSYGLRVRYEWKNRLRSWYRGLGDSDPASTVADTLAIVGMEDAETRQVETLSSGEAQRVAFARALATDPDFLLLDEPTSDLDPRNTAVIEAAMQTARSRGIGVVIATHDMNQAERVADRVAVIIHGGLIEVGPVKRVFSTPNDPRARKFINGELVY